MTIALSNFTVFLFPFSFNTIFIPPESLNSNISLLNNIFPLFSSIIETKCFAKDKNPPSGYTKDGVLFLIRAQNQASEISEM